MSGMYREDILDLLENPVHRGELDPRDIRHEEDNPLCGDVIQIDVRLDDQGRITEIAWQGDGCAISQASASLLTDEVLGKTLAEVKQITGEEMLDILGIENLSMGRIKCATLALRTLQVGVQQHDPS